MIGAQVIAVRTAMAASRVRTQTGRRPGWWPEVGPYDVAALYHSGAVECRESGSGGDDRGILGHPPVGLLQGPVGFGVLGGFEDRGGAAAQ